MSASIYIVEFAACHCFTSVGGHLRSCPTNSCCRCACFRCSIVVELCVRCTPVACIGQSSERAGHVGLEHDDLLLELSSHSDGACRHGECVVLSDGHCVAFSVDCAYRLEVVASSRRDGERNLVSFECLVSRVGSNGTVLSIDRDGIRLLECSRNSDVRLRHGESVVVSHRHVDFLGCDDVLSTFLSSRSDSSLGVRRFHFLCSISFGRLHSEGHLVSELSLSEVRGNGSVLSLVDSDGVAVELTRLCQSDVVSDNSSIVCSQFC